MISLEDKGNFVLAGTEKYVVGYWNIEEVNEKGYNFLLQGGGWTIYGRFDGVNIYFDKPYKMFDELFLQVTFKRERK